MPAFTINPVTFPGFTGALPDRGARLAQHALAPRPPVLALPDGLAVDAWEAAAWEYGEPEGGGPLDGGEVTVF